MLQPGALIDGQGTKGPKLARTITDAMDLARKLSCPFFWTDCICIVQGPGQEEIDERTMFLNEMASIYANAYVTIVAAEGADGNSGIGRCSEPRDTLWSEMQFPGHTLLLGRDCDTRHALYGRDKTWSTRGWTFQESYLSRRVFVFTSIGEAPKLITYQHFSNHASMPPGWTSRGNGERHEIKYSHSSSPDTKYLHPFPFPETAEAPLPDVEYGLLLRCVAHRGWLVKSNKLEMYDGVPMYGTFHLCLSDGTWAGILFDDRLDQVFPQKSSEKCEVIAIAEGHVPGMDSDYFLPEYRVVQRAIFPGEEMSSRRDFCYEFYFILWIGWIDGIAYRRGIGRVLKEVWENMELGEIEVTLG
ncbi:hypothetical protein THAR02_06559 [Trichoderma harzianum]|uniref:Heterokaryon incompatibility domain-containing protein n=1 Tax=Trichoderma harzianum TaxID=5544 RepID=A0A0F9ZM48_TRIHA|nr:hypothetical protein THAR02_06559 [Trichoderma harzianum]